MGGYDGQAIAGVVATSTHGSGLGFGPFPDDVRSIDLVASGGRVARFDRGDDGFDAVACGMGCMGIVDSLVLQVRPRFWLRERRVVRTWEEVRPELDDRIATEEHFELFLNPYGGHEVLETTRTEAPEPTRAVARRRRAPPAHRDPGVDPARLGLPAPRRAVVPLVPAHAVPAHAAAHGGPELHAGLPPGLQHRRGEPPARAVERARGARRGGRAPARGRPHPRDRRRDRAHAPPVPHVADRPAVRRAVGRLRLDDARPADDDDRAHPHRRDARRPGAPRRVRTTAGRPGRTPALGSVQRAGPSTPARSTPAGRTGCAPTSSSTRPACSTPPSPTASASHGGRDETRRHRLRRQRDPAGPVGPRRAVQGGPGRRRAAPRMVRHDAPAVVRRRDHGALRRLHDRAARRAADGRRADGEGAERRGRRADRGRDAAAPAASRRAGRHRDAARRRVPPGDDHELRRWRWPGRSWSSRGSTGSSTTSSPPTRSPSSSPGRARTRWSRSARGVPVGDVMLVAAHAWDVSGALAAGTRAAFVARPGMVPSPIGDQAGARRRGHRRARAGSSRHERRHTRPPRHGLPEGDQRRAGPRREARRRAALRSGDRADRHLLRPPPGHGRPGRRLPPLRARLHRRPGLLPGGGPPALPAGRRRGALGGARAAGDRPLPRGDRARGRVHRPRRPGALLRQPRRRLAQPRPGQAAPLAGTRARSRSARRCG